MRKLLFALLAGAMACGPGAGKAEAHLVLAGVDTKATGVARSGWCPASRVLMLEVSDDDRVAGLVWRYDSLVPGTVQVGPPTALDTVNRGASVAARYVTLDEVRGYRSVSGTMQVTAVDTPRISVTVLANLQQVGKTDTLLFRARFDRIPLTYDRTLCVP